MIRGRKPYLPVIIPDMHSQFEQLEHALTLSGYALQNGAWRHAGPRVRDRSMSEPPPPPPTPENPFSVWGHQRIFLLFSKVVADGLLSATLVGKPK